MQRASIVGAKTIIVIALLVSVVGQAWVIPSLVGETLTMFPEVEHLRLPGIAGLVALVLTAQVALVCIWRLLSMVAADRIFDRSAFGPVTAIVWCLLAAALMMIGAIGILNASRVLPPGVLIVLGVGAVAALGMMLLMVVMRGLLRKAAQLEHDLAEVV